MKVILIVNLGSPDSLEESQTVLRRMFLDKHILPLKFPLRQFVAFQIARKSYRKSWAKYQAVGGSPSLGFMDEMVLGLQKLYPDYELRFANRYSQPLLGTILKQLNHSGVDELLVLPFYPQYSDCTTGSVEDLVRRKTKKLQVKVVEKFYNHPAYIDYYCDLVKAQSSDFLLFTAHSIPVGLLEKGDPYVDQVNAFCQKISERLNLPMAIGFQSQTEKGKWVGPMTDEVLTALAKESKYKKVTLVPVSFCNENLETLYDLDHHLVPFGNKLDLEVNRVVLGNADAFLPVAKQIIDTELNR